MLQKRLIHLMTQERTIQTESTSIYNPFVCIRVYVTTALNRTGVSVAIVISPTFSTRHLLYVHIKN